MDWKGMEMIVSIIEHYKDGPSQQWFADMTKAREPFITLVNKAIADMHRSAIIPYGKFGMQNVDWDRCHVDPPCMVDHAIEIFSK
jgi:hypothetical protein